MEKIDFKLLSESYFETDRFNFLYGYEGFNIARFKIDEIEFIRINDTIIKIDKII